MVVDHFALKFIFMTQIIFFIDLIIFFMEYIKICIDSILMFKQYFSSQICLHFAKRNLYNIDWHVQNVHLLYN